MNKDNAAQYLPLVQALADGKTIQYTNMHSPGGKWEDHPDINFCDPPQCYRIKPEPREWVLYRPAGCSDLVAYIAPISSFREGIRVREILD